MHSLLKEIVAEKKKEIDRLKKGEVQAPREDDLPPVRDFRGTISGKNQIHLIAETKFASPTAGTISEKKDAVTIGKIYEKAGAAAISLLTDKRFFHGDITDLPRLKNAISLPILRKDFVLDEIQVRESFLWGADAVLLIARILSRRQLKRLLALCGELRMAALTEVHDRADLEKAADCGAELIGINNRNLDTFEVDLGTTIELAPLAPNNSIVVSESGIWSGKDIRLMKRKGVNAVLVGTSIMTSDDPAEKAGELVRAGRIEGDKGQDLRHNRP